jgi:hypothetical protein
MGSHDPFGHLTHKLWPKEGSWIKLLVWLPTTKSWKLPWFPCVQVVCDIPLNNSWQGLKLSFRPHFNWSFEEKFMGPPKPHESKLWEVWDTHLGVPRQNVIWVLVPWPGTEYTIRGKVVASLKSGPWWVLWVWGCPWLILTPKVPKLCINQLVWFV